jgi:hypothetical protein
MQPTKLVRFLQPSPEMLFAFWKGICSVFLLCAATALAQSNPVPLLYQPLIPASIEPGHASFVATVHGTGFVPGAVVVASGETLRTKFISGSTLEAEVPAQYVAKPRTGFVTVVNPGSIASNVVFFSVRSPSSTVQMRVDPHFTAPSGAVAAGDFNNDGKLDVAVGQENTDGLGWTISVYLGNGNGTFQAPIQTDLPEVLGFGFFGLTTGDFNGDGLLDLAAYWYGATDDGAVVLLNNGDGTFTQVPSYDGNFTTFADLNGDGKLDAIETNYGNVGYGAWVSLGNGDGTFTAADISLNFINFSPSGMDVFGDFNGDGRLDLAMAGSERFPPTPAVAVFLRNSDGTFQNPGIYPVSYGGGQLLVADMNGDGNLDLITDGCVLLGAGDGTFAQGSCRDVRGDLASAVGDFNGDGKMDLANLSTGQTLQISLGNGDGTFQPPISFPAGVSQSFFYYGPLLGDFNGDGKLDFVVGGGTPLLGLQVPK